MLQHILLYENKKILLMFDLVIMQYEKRIFSTKDIKCDMSNFSEFHQDYEYASHILFYLGRIFANLIAKQPPVIFTTNYLQHSVL